MVKPVCRSDKRGHIVNAHGQCQWCHMTREQLRIQFLETLLVQLAEYHRNELVYNCIKETQPCNCYLCLIKSATTHLYKCVGCGNVEERTTLETAPNCCSGCDSEYREVSRPNAT